MKGFFQFYTLLFSVRGAILTGLFLFNFKTTHCKNHFDTNLVKIHYAVIQILSFSCSVLFDVTANGGHLGMQYCKKKSKRIIQEIFWHKVGSLSTNGSWDIVIFMFICYGPWRPSWIVNLHKFKIVPFKKSKRLQTRNIMAQSWILFIFCAIFNNDKWRPHWSAKLQKNQNGFIQDSFWYKAGSISRTVMRNCHFCVNAILVTAPGGHLDRYILFTCETKPATRTG